MVRLLVLLLVLSITPVYAGDVYNPGFSSVGDYPDVDNPSGSSTIACSYTPVTTGTQNVAYTGATPSASGGVPAYTFSETGSLPSGLSISSSTGVISGTPTVSGTFPGIQVKVADTIPTTVNCGAAFTLVISAESFAVSLTAQNSSTAGTASYTFAAQSIGAADSTRIVCVLFAHGINTAAITGVTIGGVSATQVSGAATPLTSGMSTDAWYAAIPTGTTADVVATFTGAQTRVAIAVYRAVGTGVAISSGVRNTSASVSTLTQTATIPSGGGAIGIIEIHSATAGTITPTNLSNDTGSLVFGSSTAVAGKNVTNSGSTSMGYSWTGGAVDVALSIVAFSP
jgi:Putative Ig domain